MSTEEAREIIEQEIMSPVLTAAEGDATSDSPNLPELETSMETSSPQSASTAKTKVIREIHMAKAIIAITSHQVPAKIVPETEKD